MLKMTLKVIDDIMDSKLWAINKIHMRVNMSSLTQVAVKYK